MRDAPLRILLVEDEPAHAEAIRRAFRAAGPGAVIRVAGTLKEYRELAAAGPPDIAIMDLKLPDGQAVEVLTSPPEDGPFPILVISSYGDEQVAVKAMKAGALDYVVKSSDGFAAMPRTAERALREWQLRQERKRAEEALRRTEENFRRSLDESPLGVRIVTAEGETIYANRAILDIYGFSSLEELRTTPVEKRYTSESYIEFKKRFEKRQQGEDSPSEYEVNVVRKNGEVRHLLVSRKGQLWNGKKQYQLLYRDITERKQAEAQLRQSQKMEAIGQLAGGVAHDFNNLLTGILGNIAIMRGSLPPADPLLENLTAAETSARQAADLTKGLLTFSRSAMVLPVPMNITAALDATLALLKQSLPATMDIVRDDEQTAWNVLVDQSQITQILLNLAVNARDAMEGRGTLTIRARNEVVGEEYLQAHPFARTGEFVHLSVTDTGPGMSSEVMQHLFEPFYTTKPIGSGTGLGLSVVYGAVKQAGGWITAVSAENVGVTFDIYLPRCLEKPAQSFTPSPPSVNVRGGTVLVVEDEPVVRTVTQALLSRSGYTVLTAPDGASALNVLRDHPVGIGLILLDMTMPGMTTREIVQAIRALDPTVPILLNSGYTSNNIIKQMLEEGSAQGFLSKPYSLGELMGKVQELLHRG